MKITNIQVKNFRLLKNLKLDLEEILSIIIGKNNCGKTSLLSILNRFIGDKSSSNCFTYDDFNIEFKKQLYSCIEDENKVWERDEGISLLIIIEYSDRDNLANISDLMLDLNPDNKKVVLKFEYLLNIDDFNKMKEKFEEYETKYDALSVDRLACFESFIKSNYKNFFKIKKKAVQFNNDTQDVNLNEFIDLDKKKVDISKIINFKYISAHRAISNIDNDGTLSNLSSKYYEKTEINDSQNKAIEKFENTLIETDSKLSIVYDDLFKDVVQKVKRFGGMKKDETVIKVISSLQRRELLKGNTTVVYDDNCHSLPESYNGLGYLNLISMIFEIETLLSDFRRDNRKEIKPADINLLFIEEPEAHTHPQMQYIFIKNIKGILEEGSDGSNGNKSFQLQTIITTHSAHIVSECEFDDIKYFKKNNINSIESKNLKLLEIEYGKEKEIGKAHFKFLKQYLTLNRSEIFFADKAIFIEGDTERILVPAMMKKIDEVDTNAESVPLLSQNISIVEVGNYSQIFDKFIAFIGIKSLIITDIDSFKFIDDKDSNGVVKKNKDGINKQKVEAAPVEDSTNTSNGALKHYYGKEIENYLKKAGTKEINYFKNLDIKDKTLSKKSDNWKSSSDGFLMLVYQVAEANEDGDNYNARSFEDAFFHINRKLVIDNKDNFNSLKNISYFDEKLSSGEKYKYNSYTLAEKCIQSKPSFAMDVLLNSESNDISSYSNWKIPKYIEDGLLWLKGN
ncbi:ATP-dependent nuclease [Clostridium paridis]|uniref:AAA family ATPase n=1 Tax=Clostridium paridis TaxID=2803863 RepID=A0A937K2S8_9CLOT|nr:AAA family ATPase [Clostridium paridis]MBL4930942.1 AAA family ATPase [Clostridium paridis]